MDHVPSQPEHDADAGVGSAALSRTAKRRLLAALALLVATGFVALGVWQVQRRAWKHDLIARVEARVHAAPAALPAFDAPLDPRESEYRRVTARGTFLHDRETLVQAVTVHGGGWWVVTPLRTADGVVLINRGFVPSDRRDPDTRPAPRNPVQITGLLRLTEPGGGFLRSNDPAADRWYSRDVAAIARARGLGPVAPYFVDADATPSPGGMPIGGLTVIHFPDNHLPYALTWFALAILSLAGGVLLLRMRDRR